MSSIAKRQLVFSANEDTWPKDRERPVLFLSGQCKQFSRECRWKDLDSKVVPHHWTDREKFYTDYQMLQIFYEKTLSVLANHLNKTHQVSYSLRYWRILIGPWLWFFSARIFDYWSTLDSVLSSEKKYYCTILKQDTLANSFIANGSEDFFNLIERDDWNEVIYSQLITSYWPSKVIISQVDRNDTNNFERHIKSSQKRKNRIRKIAAFFQNLYTRDDSYFFLNTYIPSEKLSKLQKKLSQFPSVWKPIPAPISKYDATQREWVLEIGANNDFEHAMQTIIPLHIPILYLEGYKLLSAATDKLPWPKNPKAMLTSNSFFSDDMFKAWSAKKSELGIPLIIGQHGGCYGSGLFLWNETHEIKIADKWLSWGWSDKSNIVPIGNLKITGDQINYNPKGGVLIVLSGLSRYPYPYPFPVAEQWLDYFNDQKVFLEKLPDKIRGQSIVRLDRRSRDNDVVAHWRDEMSKVSEVVIDLGDEKLQKAIQKNRLCVVAYNATTYLESLSWNVPTIMFWNPGHWELREQAKPYFEILESAGIFHTTPQSAAQQVARIWDDLEGWWQSNEVQQARDIFIKQYSATSESAIDLLKGALVQVNK